MKLKWVRVYFGKYGDESDSALFESPIARPAGTPGDLVLQDPDTKTITVIPRGSYTSVLMLPESEDL